MVVAICAVVPNVYVLELKGQKEYAMVLTQDRVVFVLRRTGWQGVGLVLGGAVGALAAGALTPQAQGDLWARELRTRKVENMAGDPRNTQIPHASVRVLRTRKTLTRYELYIEYVGGQGELKKFWGEVRPTPDYVKVLRHAGAAWKKIHQDYAREVQDAYRNALPSSTRLRPQWGF